MDELKCISIDDLYGEQKELAELVGMETYLRLVHLAGGSNIYIAKADKLLNIHRNKKIKKEFTGNNIMQLSKKYSLSERQVRNIVQSEDADINIDDDEITLFSYI